MCNPPQRTAVHAHHLALGMLIGSRLLLVASSGATRLYANRRSQRDQQDITKPSDRGIDPAIT
jgi:hypothetical protein